MAPLSLLQLGGMALDESYFAPETVSGWLTGRYQQRSDGRVGCHHGRTTPLPAALARPPQSEERVMAKQRLWGIPFWTVAIAAVVIGIFMVIAYCLYSSNYGVSTASNAYWLKVGDALINGAIVGIFLAVVKAIFDLPKLVQEWFAGERS
jgi:hypothetical protein